MHNERWGDARKAVELLAKSVRVAEETTGYLGEEEVDIAEHWLEVDNSTELIDKPAVITFEPRIFHKLLTIELLGPLPALITDLTIDASQTPDVTVNAGERFKVFNITGNSRVKLINITGTVENK